MGIECLLVVLLGVILLCALVVFFDNSNRATTNGLWKSIDVRAWMYWQPDRRTDGGNLLYYPVIASITRVLPAATGEVWQRMAFVNAGVGGLILGLTYLIALRLFESRPIAVLTCLVQVASAFFLLLTTISEDIVPGYFWFVAAVALVVLPRRHSVVTTVLASQCVALSWLFHSSLQLPGVGAIGLGLLLSAPSIRAAMTSGAIFGLALLPLPALAPSLFGLPWHVGFWSGKGVGTGWGGFAVNKLAFEWTGIAQYLVGGQNVTSIETLSRPQHIIATSVTWVLLMSFALALFREFKLYRHRSEWRCAAAVFAAVFVLAELMNLYIQPQDPQMQLQPMMWVPFGAASLGAQVLRAGALRRFRVPVVASLVAATLVLLAVNVEAYAGQRHADSVAVRNIRQLEAVTDPSRTVFLVQGFEGLTTWLTVAWGRGVTWPNDPDAQLAGKRRFNSISLAAEATVYPTRSAADAAIDAVRYVNAALDAGYAVVATDIWTASERQWVAGFSTVSAPDKPRAIRSALRNEFAGRAMTTIEEWGTFHQISRR